jgi:hypothetical protein
MSVLLRQPGGFEGFLLGVKVAPPDALPTPPTDSYPELPFKGHVATAAVSASAQGGDRHVSKIAQFDNVDGVVGKSVEQVLPQAPNSLVAVIAAFQGGEERVGLHLLVHQCQKGTKVTPVEGVIESVVQVQVLPRHRPRSIPQAQESA